MADIKMSYQTKLGLFVCLAFLIAYTNDLTKNRIEASEERIMEKIEELK